MASSASAPYQQAPQGLEIVQSDFWGAPVFRDTSTGELSCPGYTGATYATNLWDTIVIGGFQAPGIVTIPGEKGRDLDKKKSSGTDGQRLTFHGIVNAEGTMRFMIWTPGQWEALKALFAVILPGPQKVTTITSGKILTPRSTTTVINSTTPGFATQTIPQASNAKQITKSTSLAKPQPFDVSFPGMRPALIKSVVFIGQSLPEAGPVVNSKIFTVKWIEYFPPGKTDTTQSASGSQAKGSTLDPGSNPPPGSVPAANDP